MADLAAMAMEMTAQHDALTKAYETAHVKAQAATDESEKHAKALTEFRSKYGNVLKALQAGAVKVK